MSELPSELRRLQEAMNKLITANGRWLAYFDFLDSQNPGDPLTAERRRLHAKRLTASQEAIEAAALLDIPRIITALAPAVKPLVWEPIDSAPKDGTDFLAAWDDDEFHVVCIRDGECHRAMDDREFWSMPTHWMPLPEPPTN